MPTREAAHFAFPLNLRLFFFDVLLSKGAEQGGAAAGHRGLPRLAILGWVVMGPGRGNHPCRPISAAGEMR